MSKPPEFDLPDGYQPPDEGMKEGAEFQDLATFRLKPGGKTMCLIEVGEGRHAIRSGSAHAPAQPDDYRSQSEARYASQMPA